MINRIMIDLETLGTTPGSIILSLGATLVGFPHIRFYAEIDPEDSEMAGLTMDAATVKYWMRQSTEARQFTDPYRLGFVLAGFADWIALFSNAEVWGNGSSFDNQILASAYQRCGMRTPWDFRKNRCYRTIAKIFPQISAGDFVGTRHNALDDALHQAQHLHRIIKHIELIQETTKEG